MKNMIIVGAILFIIGGLVGFGADRVYIHKKLSGNDRQTSQQAEENAQEAKETRTDTNEEDSQDKAAALNTNEISGTIAGPSLTGQVSASAAKNSVSVEDQKPGNVVLIQSLTLGIDGWVVVHDDIGGKPGHILGAHRFNAGTYTGQNVELLKETEEGKVYYAMLHTDDGDKKFDYRVDLPVKDETGNPLMMRFVATAASAQ